MGFQKKIKECYGWAPYQDFHFSTPALFLVHHKTAGQFFQPIFKKNHIETAYDTIHYQIFFNMVVK